MFFVLRHEVAYYNIAYMHKKKTINIPSETRHPWNRLLYQLDDMYARYWKIAKKHIIRNILKIPIHYYYWYYNICYSRGFGKVFWFLEHTCCNRVYLKWYFQNQPLLNSIKVELYVEREEGKTPKSFFIRKIRPILNCVLV